MLGVFDRIVCLRPGRTGEGITVPIEALSLLWALEERGFGFIMDHDTDALVVYPSQNLTPEDCDAIRKWKWHLRALLAYVPPAVS